MIFVILFGVVLFALFCGGLLFYDIWRAASANKDGEKDHNGAP